jgi:uncharacterized protein YqfA (UPF0365 family)
MTFYLFIIIFLALIIGYGIYARLDMWVEAKSNGVKLSIIDMGLMRFRQMPIENIIKALTKISKAKLDINYEQLERHYLSGGNITAVVDALVIANSAFKNQHASNAATPKFGFAEATGIDLSRKDVVAAIRTWVQPRVIVTERITAIAKDRVQVFVKARITIQTNFERYIGGANEETIIARVGEGLLSQIGAHLHEEILESPREIADKVETVELDYDKAAYRITSIDIDELSIGKNIGVELEMERAEADKKMAQAHAEKRRSVAIAFEQEAKAEAERSRANLIRAEADIPAAIAEALRNGKMSFSDYNQYKNLKADTEMRESVSKSILPPPKTNQNPFDSDKTQDTHQEEHHHHHEQDNQQPNEHDKK